MSEQRAPYSTTSGQPVTVTHAPPDEWERKLIAKVRELRLLDKRVILLVDGARVFIYTAEPRGTLALD